MALFNRNPNEVACAKELYTNYLLYELGAYNYLIYLREKPKKH